MTIDPAAIEAAKRIVSYCDANRIDKGVYPDDFEMAARALLDAKIHLDAANKALLAHLDAAGGQEGGKEAGAKLGTSIVVAVLAHRKARAKKAEAEVAKLRGILDAERVEFHAEYEEIMARAEKAEVELAALRQAVRETLEDARGNPWGQQYTLRILHEKTAPHMGEPQ